MSRKSCGLFTLCLLAGVGIAPRDAAAGEPRIALVEGAGGIGKTSLLRRFLATADPEPDTVLWAACQEDTSIPYLAFAEALRFSPARGWSSGRRGHSGGLATGRRT